ncbi:MAG TPA: hypothetical protein VK609_05815 [Mucilaginibacter sp.]|nr:hypothetical protein [Mucilaginibacter sp.]
MPKDVHLSVSHHPNSPDINLHVTRNFGLEKDKPQLVICTINRGEVMACFQSGFAQLFELLFEPVNPADLKYAEFISFDRLKWMERDAAAVMNDIQLFRIEIHLCL